MTPGLAIVGGSGVHAEDLLDDGAEQRVDTAFGEVAVTVGTAGGQTVAFLPRHGPDHSVPPHRIRYRANIRALAELGVERIVATAAVGAIDPDLTPGSLVIVDQFMDFTRGRPATFHDGGAEGVVHVDVSDPYCASIRATLATLAHDLPAPVKDGATYVCTEGPRFETAAEIAAFGRLGGDVVGMTGVPEVVLARELGLCYATVATVTNAAAGLATHRLTHEAVLDVQQATSRHLTSLLAAVFGELSTDRSCSCHIRPQPLGGSA